MRVLTKKELRDRVRRIRNSLLANEYLVLSQRIRENIRSLAIFKSAKVVLAFCPFDGEPDISPLFDELLQAGKSLVLPKVEGRNMRLCKVGNLERLSLGNFCILEPVICDEVEPEKVDLALVPGVAFDRGGCRLGMGKGYYDRILGRIKGFKLGVAFSFQVFEEIPCDPWDQSVDAVITEEGILTGGKKDE